MMQSDNPWFDLTLVQVQERVAAHGTENEDDMALALERLAALASEAQCHSLALLLETLADEPEEVAVSRLSALATLATRVHPDSGERAIVYAAIDILNDAEEQSMAAARDAG